MPAIPPVRRVTAVLLTSLLTAAGVIALPGAAAAAECGPGSGNYQQTDKEWELKRLQPERAWPLTKGEGQIVGVIDSGVSDGNPALDGQLVTGKDFVGEDQNCDNVGHGTVIAGIIAARYEPGALFYGIAPEARVMPLRVAIDDQSFSADENSVDHVAEAIRWGADHGATVLNLSLRTEDTDGLRSAIEYAIGKDVVIVAASGNTEKDQVQPGTVIYPAAYDGVLAVGSIDQQGMHVATSNTGNFVDLAAPGVNILGPAAGDDGVGFFQDGGTSFATAFVSGTAALVRAYYPELSAAEVIERLEATADAPPGGWNDRLGYGVVNPYRAVTGLNGELLEPVAPAAAEKISAPTAVPDPLADLKFAAALTAVGAAAVAIAVLSGHAVRRHVKRREADARRGGRPAVLEPNPPA